MYKTFWMMLLIVMSNNAVAEWVEVSKNSNMGIIVYADPKTIYKSDDQVEIWVLVDLDPAEGHSREKVFKSIKLHVEFDCKKKKKRKLYGANYSKNMGRGELVNESDAYSNWKPVVPENGSDDGSEDIWKYACGK